MANVNIKIEFTEQHEPNWAEIDKTYEVKDKTAYHIYKRLQKFALRFAELKKPQDIDKTVQKE